MKGDDIGPGIAELIRYYMDNRSVEETFNQFVNRVGVPAFQDKLTDILTAVAS